MSDRFGNIEIEKPTSPQVTEKIASPSKARKSPARKPKSRRKQQRKPGKKWLWIALIAGLFSLYSLIGFFGVPYYLNNIFPTQYYQNTGMILETESIQFNPFMFSLHAKHIKLKDDTGTTILGINTLSSSLRPFSLLRNDMVCNEITIEKPEVHLIRQPDGKYNVNKVFGGGEGGEGTDIIEFSDLPFFFSLNNIRVRDGLMVFEDLPTSKTHHIENIQVDLPTLSNIPVKSSSPLTPYFSATINGSPIELRGKTKSTVNSGADSDVSELTCALHNIDLQSYLTYLPIELPFIIEKGTANGTINLSFDPAAPKGEKFSFGFELQLTGSELSSRNSSLRSEVPSALLTGDLLPVSKTLAFSKIVLHKPTLKSYGKSLLSNLDNVLTNSTSSKDQINPTKVQLKLDIHSLTIMDGHLSLFHKNSDKKAHAEWITLKLKIEGYSSDTEQKLEKNPGSFHFSGKQLNSPAYFTWDGEFKKQHGIKGSYKVANYKATSFFQNLNLKVNDFNSVMGEIDAQGQVELFINSENSSNLKYQLTESELLIKNFKLRDNKKIILSAKLVKSSPLSTTGQNLNFGSLSIVDGSLALSKGKMPAFFTKFSQKSSPYLINSFSFSGKAEIQTNRKPQRSLTFSNLQLKADSLNNAKSSENNLEIVSKLSSGGIINAQGSVTLKPFGLLSDVKFNKLGIRTFLPLLAEASFFPNTTGFLTGEGKFELPNFRFIGGVQTSSIAIDSPDFPKLTWQKSIFSELNFTTKPFHLGLTNIEIYNPTIHWSFSSFAGKPQLHIRSFFQNHFLPPKPIKKDAEKRISLAQLNVQDINVSDGKIFIVDQRLSPQWKAEISNFSGKLSNIHSSKSAVLSSFSFTGNLDESPFTLSGDMNIFGDKIASNHVVELTNYPLSAFNDQLKSRNNIDTSRTSFDLSYKSKSEIDKTHTIGEIVFKDMKPASSTAEAAITLAMLSSSDDFIKMEYDFENQIQNKNIPLFSELSSVFDTKIIKGAVSPLLLANGDFTDLIDNEFVEFTPGEFMLTGKGRDILARYTAFLIAHPKIGLELSGGYDKTKDLIAIKNQLEKSERQRVDAINEKMYSEWLLQQENYEKKLAEQKRNLQEGNPIAEIDMPKNLMDGYTPIEAVPVAVDEVMLLELAEKRLEIINQFFTTQLALEPGRIIITPPVNQSNITVEDANGVVISLFPSEF